jgi:glucosamine-6-phosphate deaminase
VQVVRASTADAAAVFAADIIERSIEERPGLSLLPATGTTPMPVYRLLGERHRQGMRANGLHIFQLDDYVGVSGDDPRSLYGWMHRELLESLEIGPDRVTRLRGDAPDLDGACRAYDAAVEEAGGIDLALLGLGLDGHLGYNEPPSPADAPTRVVTLLPQSRATAASYWPPGHTTPDRGITAGMTVILGSTAVILLVTGAHKREILRRVLNGPVGPEVPASFLRTMDNVTVVADGEALGSDE